MAYFPASVSEAEKSSLPARSFPYCVGYCNKAVGWRNKPTSQRDKATDGQVGAAGWQKRGKGKLFCCSKY